MNTFGHKTPVRDEAGEIVALRPTEVARVTRNELGGCHGPDKARKLVVTLRDGDIVAFRPHGTRREVTATAHDLYTAVLRWQANKVNLEKARERKEALKVSRAAARIAAADRRIKAQAKANKS